MISSISNFSSSVILALLFLLSPLVHAESIKICDENQNQPFDQQCKAKLLRLSATARYAVISTNREGHGKFSVVDIKTGNKLFSVVTRESTPRIDFTPDETKLAYTNGDNIILAEVTSGRILALSPKVSLGNEPREIIFSPDGGRLQIDGSSLASGDHRDFGICILDATSLKIQSCTGNNPAASDMYFNGPRGVRAWLPNGKQFIECGNGCQIWDTETHRVSKVIPGLHEYRPDIVFAVSPDGKLIYTPAHDALGGMVLDGGNINATRPLTVWSLETGALLSRKRISDEYHISSISITPDGKTISCVNGTKSPPRAIIVSANDFRVLGSKPIYSKQTSGDYGELMTNSNGYWAAIRTVHHGSSSIEHYLETGAIPR